MCICHSLFLSLLLVLSGLRRHEDGWVFEEPVSEDIAPGYFDVVEKPMDFQTIEKKIENLEYTVKDQVRREREKGGGRKKGEGD